jgi:hypothetical protein
MLADLGVNGARQSFNFLGIKKTENRLTKAISREYQFLFQKAIN